MICHLTDEDYKIAEANGIHRDLAYVRFYYKSWERERAITKPPQDSLWEKYKNRCAAIGLSQSGFYKRLKKMSPEEAVAFLPGARKRKINLEHVQIAARNGIKESTFRTRIYAHWGIERAMTEPVHPNHGNQKESSK